MKMPIYSAVAIGYGFTIFFIADFISFIIVSNIIVRSILGIILLLGSVRFYLGSKNIKSFEFSAHPPKIKICYYKSE
jgi:hypothetical protein